MFYQSNVKTAKPIGYNFFVATCITLENGMDYQKGNILPVKN